MDTSEYLNNNKFNKSVNRSINGLPNLDTSKYVINNNFNNPVNWSINGLPNLDTSKDVINNNFNKPGNLSNKIQLNTEINQISHNQPKLNIKLSNSSNTNNIAPTYNVNIKKIIDNFEMFFMDTIGFVDIGKRIEIPDYISALLLHYISAVKILSTKMDVNCHHFFEITTKSFPFISINTTKIDLYFVITRNKDCGVKIYVKKNIIDTECCEVEFTKIDIMNNNNKFIQLYNNFKLNRENYSNYAIKLNSLNKTLYLNEEMTQFFDIASNLLNINVSFNSKLYNIENMKVISIKSELISSSLEDKPLKCYLSIKDTGLEYKYYLEPLNDLDNKYDVISNIDYKNGINFVPKFNNVVIHNN